MLQGKELNLVLRHRKENKIWQRKQKKEWIELFNSIDDDVKIEIAIEHSKHYEKGKLKKIGITIYN